MPVGGYFQDVLNQYQTAVAVDKSQLDSAQASLSLLQAGNRPDAIAAARDEVKQSHGPRKFPRGELEPARSMLPAGAEGGRIG